MIFDNETTYIAVASEARNDDEKQVEITAGSVHFTKEFI